MDSLSKKETKKPVNQERNSPSAVNSGLSADQEQISNKNSKKTVDSRSKKESKKPVNQEPSELPQNFKNFSDMGGSRITLLIEKTLYHSNLNPRQNRLSIPSQQDKDFLLPTELEILEEKKGIKVKLIQPSLETTELTLIKWFMHKGPESEKVSISYILRSNWVKVAKANNLEKDDVVQVWSFRVDEKLCMAIVKL
nr:B3 domain-containing protein At1g05920 [Arachis hypogaea]